MNIESLYGTQAKVDDKIAEKLEGGKDFLSSYENIQHRQFAFKVEVMELANEIGFFKDWKHSHTIKVDAALEELADCMAFLLSTGLSLGYDRVVKEVEPFEMWADYPYEDLFDMLTEIQLSNVGKFTLAFKLILGIGLKIGASETAIMYAYVNKSAKNIERQTKGY